MGSPFRTEADLQAHLQRAQAWRRRDPGTALVPEPPAHRKERNDNQTSIPFANVEQAPGYAPLSEKATARLDTRCSIHVHSRRHRLTDPDGISAKAAIDGLVLAGVLPDDSTKCVSQVFYSQEKIGSEEIEETVIEIVENKNPGMAPGREGL